MSLPAAASATWPQRAAGRPRVLTVCRVELKKLAAQTPARLAGAVCLLAPFAFVAILKAQQAVPADTLFGRWVHVSGFAVPLVILGFSGAWGFPVLAGLVAGDIFASEDRHGTWKTALTRSRGRGELFAGKALAAAAFTVAAVCLLAFASLAAGLLAIGSQPLVGLSGTVLPAGHVLGLVIASWALAIVPALGFTSLALLLSVVTRSSVVGVLGPALIGLVMQLLALVGNGEVVRTLLLATSFDAWHGLFTAHPYYRPIEQAAIVSAVYALVCLSTAWYVFQRRDFAGSAPDRQRSWVTPARWATAAAGLVAFLGIAGSWGPTGVTAGKLEAAITPTFANLVVLQQRLLGRRIPEHASLKVLATCLRRGAATPYRGPGDNWYCTLSLVAADLRQMPVNYEVNVRANGCYTADGPATIGGLSLHTAGKSTEPNPLYQFDGCFEV